MSDTSLFSGRDLRDQREKIRRSFLRANTAIAVVLIAVLGLALVAVVASVRASRSQRRAELAEQDARERLWNSYLAQARAARLGGERGYRLQALTAVSNAASFRASTELRNEAIAALTSSDLEPESVLLPLDGLAHRVAIQSGLELYGVANSFGEMTIRRMSDASEVARIGVDGSGLPKGSLMAGFEFGSDRRHVFTVFKNGLAAAWEVKGGPPVWVRTNVAGQRLIGLTFARESRLCVAEYLGTESRIRLVDLPSGVQQVSLTLTGAVHGASVRPGASHVAICYGEETQLWDYERKKRISSFRTPTPGLEPVWSPDGNQVALANVEGTIYLKDVASGGFKTLIGHVEKLRSMVFSPDGAALLSASWDNTTRLWDTTSGRAIVNCTGEIGSSFSEDGGRIGYVKLGEGVGTWRFERSALLETLQQSPRASRTIRHFDLSPGNRWLAAVTADGVFLWDLSNGNRPGFAPLTGVSSAVILADETNVLLCRDGDVELREILGRDSVVAPSLGPPRRIPVPSGSKSFQATIALDGRTVLVESRNHNLRVLDLEHERAPVTLKGRPRFRHYFPPATGTGSGRLAISPDGRWVGLGYGIVSTNDPDGLSSVAAWDARTGDLVFHPEGHFGSVVFTPDSRHLVLRSVDHCRIFKVGSWELERSIPLENLAGNVGTAAAPEGGGFLAMARSRQIIELVEPQGARELGRLTVPFAGSVSQLRGAMDGSRLAVVTPEARVHLWDLNGLRRALAAMGLDWSDGLLTRASAGDAASIGAFTANPARMIVVGFAVVAVAVFAAFVVLRRHRQLITRFVRTEATVEKRDRQLESARLELMQAEKMKALGTLAAGIAHDFNNLLSVIRMSNQLIPRSRSPKETTEYVAAVEQAVLQGKMVVGSMLGYSREAAPDDNPSDICVLVEEAALLLSKEFLSGVELGLNLDRSTPAVRINKGKLQQALLNLVVNAAEALKGSGRLTISVSAIAVLPELPEGRFATRPGPASSYVQIEVADSGPGIPEGILDRIFEPFFTTKTAGTRKGTGLGLSLVHTVANQEGLGLAVRSKPGAGATFYLYIPGN
jgi:signal transduction histidine kinase